MDKKVLESVVGSVLIPLGFKKRAASWYRQTEGALQLVDLQTSSYGMQFYVNLCCVPAGMEIKGLPMPRAHEFPIRVRLTTAFPTRKDEIENAFDLEASSLDDAERAEQVTRLVDELVLPVLSYMEDASSIKQAVDQDRLKVSWINLRAQKYLGLDGAN